MEAPAISSFSFLGGLFRNCVDTARRAFFIAIKSPVIWKKHVDSGHKNTD
jgi:hypothetical protein